MHANVVFQNLLLKIILRQTVSPRQQIYGGRIVDISRAHCLLRRTGLAFALSAQLIISGGIGDLARAEDHPPSPQAVVSACRPTAGLAAFGGRGMKVQSGMNKGSEFARTAALHTIAGDYERAFEQFDRAIDLNPENPNFYLGRGAAHLRNREPSHAVEDFNKAIALNPASSVAFHGPSTGI